MRYQVHYLCGYTLETSTDPNFINWVTDANNNISVHGIYEKCCMWLISRYLREID